MGGARLPEVAVDDERADAVRLRQKPREVQSRQGLPFADARARDDESLHLLALARLKNACPQRPKILTVRRAWLRNGDEMRFDARCGDVQRHKLRESARRPSSVQSCPSLTRSYHAGECRPGARIGVRSGR